MKKALILALLFIPALASAAGFAPSSLFLSKSPVTDGDSVRVYAIVANTASSKFVGSVVIRDGELEIGSSAVSIEAGGTQTASLPWKPAAGSHIVTAELTGSDGAVIEKQSASFTIAEKPKPVTQNTATSSAQSTAVESSQTIQNQIGGFSPAAQRASAPVFQIIDGLRDSAAQFIDSQIVNTKNNLEKNARPGIVEGATTESPKLPDPISSFWFILYTLYLYLLTILRFLVGNAGIFYPVLAIAFLYFLWRTFRRFRRPSY